MIRAQEGAVLGELAWDLGAQTQYAADQALPVAVTVFNPTAAGRAYQLEADVFKDGQLEWYSFLAVGGATAFPVEAISEKSIQWSFQYPQTGRLLRLSLIDVGDYVVVATVETQLAASPAGQDILAAMGPLLAVALLGGLVPMMTGTARRRRDGK